MMRLIERVTKKTKGRYRDAALHNFSDFTSQSEVVGLRSRYARLSICKRAKEVRQNESSDDPRKQGEVYLHELPYLHAEQPYGCCVLRYG